MKFLSVRLWLQTAFGVIALSLSITPILAADLVQIPVVTVQNVEAQDNEDPTKTSRVMSIPLSQTPQDDNHFLLPPHLDEPIETNHDGFFLRIYPAGPAYTMRIFPIDPSTDYKLKIIPPSSSQLDQPIEMPNFMP